MATAMAVPPLAPRPIAVWSPPKHHHHMDGKENRPSLKHIQQTTPPARSRRERPCDGCRRRKSKCVLQENRRCVLCEFHKQDCTFVENAQPRKRKTEDAPRPDSPSKKSPASIQRSTPTTTAPSRPATAPAPLPAPLQPSMRKHFAVDETLSLQRHRHCKYLGQTTALDASLIGLGTFNEKNETESQVGTLRQVTSSEYFSTHADADVQLPDDEARALADIEDIVGSHGPALIDIYFRNVHPSYPIIQKPAFLDRHQHGDRQFNPPLLAAMYLLALAWWDRDPAFRLHPKPDTSKLEYVAITSLTIAMQRPKISAVQAGLLLLQRAKSSTWTLTVQLVALGQDIGLHLDCSDWSIPRWERLLRKRLAWALYMQDKWSAVMHGRPSHINEADWNVSIPTEEDFDETIQPLPTPSEDVDEQQARGRMVFMQMISLTSIMAEVCEAFYSETAKAEYARAGRYATQLVLTRAKPVQLKLRNWHASLPANCKMDSFTSGQLSSQGYLHLAYFATEISIHRRIVQSLDPASSEPYALYVCRSAAKTRLISALDFVNRLKPEHLDAFWFFSSASNFALIGTFGALLMATSPGREEAHFYACRLNEFKWTLTVSSKKAVWIQGALEKLDATSQMLRGLPEKPSVQPTSELNISSYHHTVNGDVVEIDRWSTEPTVA
ncbi:Transcriptional activator protein DAL81 [Fulvia fulva]|uniref:Transcriptional activator protein DAL81 n=1 Tax=Passalora fulva TaxID=5499 RepID=A0A9Q8P6R4_PASFU|nr:Transcriptional activator protein DAL81 [Fulvia fulva]KAK4628768.1 Transcriptional activator protein DAL81 [Fulvia fulva]KAK4629994.1 Transcriptional activator protein DAL81 [Fulvia fulva]UJO15107.1 Transcriptional activator protein DAL81 [Fulvia fulva]WPV13038.1 Transcriptional activator protein DAL81 [Fulvia fulva]WPV27027.1 Transcriptional activator protein DAL81 [Fulvia fulva]